MLTKFPLSQHIAKYNKENKTHYPLDEHFGCDYLGKEMFQSTADAIDTFNQSSDLYLYSHEESRVVAKQKTKLLEVKEYLHGTAEQKPDFITDHDAELRKRINEKETLYKWSKEQQEQLSNPLIWESLLSLLQNRKDRQKQAERLKAIKMNWQKHALFACHTNESLYEVAFNQLPYLIAHHKAARKHLWRSYFSMPTPIYQAYKLYLDNFLIRAKELKRPLAAAMVAKLQAMDASDFSDSNILIYITKQIQEVMGDSIQLTYPSTQQQMTEKHFRTFQHYVQKQGDSPAQSAMKQLSWRLPKGNLLTTKIKNIDGSFILPIRLRKQIPSKQRWPHWFYKGDNLRFTLMTQHQLRLAQLKKMSHTDDRIMVDDPSSLDRLIKGVQKEQQLVTQMLSEAQHDTYTDFSRIYRSTHQFFDEYRNLLRNQQQQIIYTKLAIAENIADQMKSRCTSSTTMLLPFDTCHILKNLLNDIEQDIKSHLMKDPQFQKRCESVKRQVMPILSVNRALEIIQNLAHNYLASASDVKYLFEIAAVHDKQHPYSFIQMCHSHIQDIFSHLKGLLKENPHSLQTDKLITHRDQLLCLHAVIHRLGSPEMQKAISEKALRYFLNYLENVITCGTQGDNFQKMGPALTTMEEVLGLIGAKDKYLGKVLAEHVQELRKMRIEKKWHELQVNAKTITTMIGSLFLQKHINKDSDTLDRHVAESIKKENLIDDKELTIRSVFSIRDKLIAKRTSSLSEIADEMSMHQQILIGLKDESLPWLKTLICLSATARMTQDKIQDSSTTSYSEKVSFVKQLNKKMWEVMQDKSVNSELLKTDSGKRPLFSKPYVNIPQAKNLTI